MNATGIVRKVDELGRLVLPMELRRTMNIHVGDPMEILTSEEGIILRPYKQSCHCCKETEGLVELRGVLLCPACIEAFQRKIR